MKQQQKLYLSFYSGGSRGRTRPSPSPTKSTDSFILTYKFYET